MHVLDYASRPLVRVDKSRQARLQVKAAVKTLLSEGWTRKAIYEYCNMVYPSMGISKFEIEKIIYE